MSGFEMIHREPVARAATEATTQYLGYVGGVELNAQGHEFGTLCDQSRYVI